MDDSQGIKLCICQDKGYTKTYKIQIISYDFYQCLQPE